jgi:AcrR family transcriptional regulator
VASDRTRKPKAKTGYHHGDLRRSLMDAALAIVAEGGVSSLSLREAARRAGVSSAAPYHHFASLEALAEALCDEGFEALAAAGVEALAAAGSDAGDRLGALGRSYVRFARSHPAHFRLMFSGPSNPAHKLDAERPLASFEQLVSAVREAQAQRLAPPGDPTPLVLLAWTVVHGLATLSIDGPLAHPLPGVTASPAQIDELLMSTLRSLLAASAARAHASK